MPKQILLLNSTRKLLALLCLGGIISAALIVKSRNGVLVSPTQAAFSNVVGVPAPRSVNVLKIGSTGSLSDPIDWLSFTVSQADLLEIVKNGQFQINWSMVPGLGSYPTPRDIAHRGKYLTFSSAVNAPAWWKPAHQPGRYITYERDTAIEDVSTLRVLIATPGSNVVYAAYSRPF